jgi:hypothetical protein
VGFEASLKRQTKDLTQHGQQTKYTQGNEKQEM